MNNKLYVTDLDGTLLNSNMVLSNYGVDVLNELIDLGVNITFSTSRSFYTASIMLKNVHFLLPCIIFNGAYVIRFSSGEVIKKNLLDYGIYEDIFKVSKDMELIPYVFGKTSDDEEKLLYDVPYNNAQIRFIQERKNRHDKRLHEMKSNCILEEIINLSYLYPLDKILFLEEIIRSKYDSVISIKVIKDIYNEGYYMLEIANKHANKGDMLVYISNLLGVKLADVTVFGDQSNDLEMFAIAGTKIAVNNAHDELKNQADIIIDSNDNDGVIKYFAGL